MAVLASFTDWLLLWVLGLGFLEPKKQSLVLMVSVGTGYMSCSFSTCALVLPTTEARRVGETDMCLALVTPGHIGKAQIE